MNIIEKMLSEVNEVDLHNIIKAYTNETVRDMSLSAHLQAWASNKQHIYKLFGNKLTIERDIETTLPEHAIMANLESFLAKEMTDSKYSLIKIFLNSLYAEELGENTLLRDFTMFDTVFKKGMKISKCFKFLTKKEWLHDANVKYSMFLQSLNAKGRAVLSIDPKDYLTMSANSSGWRSCHAPNGEYRAGTVAYMMDNTTVISYIKSSQDCFIPNTETVHANKIWRQIVLVNPDDTYALQARQYPNANKLNAAAISDILIEIFAAYSGKEYAVESASLRHGQGDFKHLQQCHDGTRLYYNDIECGAFETGYCVLPKGETVKTLKENPKTNIITVGVDVPCLCGCENYLEDGGSFFHENDYEEDCDYVDED